MTRRRLLFISHYTGRGGGESVQLNLMAELAGRGFTLHLVTPQIGQFSEAAARLGVQIHTIPFRGASTYFVPALYTRLPIVSKLIAVLRESQIDVIHSDYHALPFAVGAGERAGVPVIWNAMGGWFDIKRWQRRFFCERITRMIAITASVRHDLLGDPPFMPLDRMPVLIPGVDPDEYSPTSADGSAVRAKIGIAAHVPLVSLIGRFQTVKGQDVFLDMARRVAAQLPNARFALAGDNVFNVSADERFKQQIIDTVHADPVLSERVSFLGFWPDSREVLAASDVIVCSSRFESLGMVVIEAMAMGRVVVSTRVGGPSETVIDGQTGYLVKAGDSAAFADRVLMLLNNPTLRAQIGTAARRHVESALSVARYADQFVGVVDTLALP